METEQQKEAAPRGGREWGWVCLQPGPSLFASSRDAGAGSTDPGPAREGAPYRGASRCRRNPREELVAAASQPVRVAPGWVSRHPQQALPAPGSLGPGPTGNPEKHSAGLGSQQEHRPSDPAGFCPVQGSGKGLAGVLGSCAPADHAGVDPLSGDIPGGPQGAVPLCPPEHRQLGQGAGSLKAISLIDPLFPAPASNVAIDPASSRQVSCLPPHGPCPGAS
ncbi:cysteine-rich protein 2 isoform X4 [Heterocephalus glaber]|uniref:Cysteine-rich protein 2 isoform X4 n=1 Tax=Heterocephalus glaber TaxID=10181 RepID=A0AAX6RPB9_HETGA|nr:cysteine-rich protein 2 isoform X4 [Heterocephalus glaber]